MKDYYCNQKFYQLKINAEKKVIYKKTFSDTRKKLSTQFTKKEIAEIEKLERSKQKNINNN